MAIVPAGRRVGSSPFFGETFRDKTGDFFVVNHSLKEVIEATVTNGRGYIDPTDHYTNVPYDENPHRDTLDPHIFCFRRLEHDEFPNFMRDVAEGHPSYAKAHFEVIGVMQEE